MSKIITYPVLREFTKEIFMGMGCPEADANLASEVLVSADLRGVDSHGVARLIGYVNLWDKKRINPTPEVRIVHETPSTAVVDGDKGLGLVVAPKAMEIAIKKAEVVGTGWVSVKNSNHYGIAGYHAMMALEKDMIGISMTNASALVSPTFSKERLLGTNPMAFAIPAQEEDPFIADMATTTAANGKLEVLQRKGGKVPMGWVQNQEGALSDDPFELKKGGSMRPLGGDREHGSHKGYILGSVVDIFSAVLSGANYGPWVPPFPSFLEVPANPVGEGIGHFAGAMRVDAFRPADEFKQDMDNWIRRFRNSATVEGQENVLIPGDPEREMTSQRLGEGIPLLDPIIKDLEGLANRFKVDFPDL